MSGLSLCLMFHIHRRFSLSSLVFSLTHLSIDQAKNSCEVLTGLKPNLTDRQTDTSDAVQLI